MYILCIIYYIDGLIAKSILKTIINCLKTSCLSVTVFVHEKKKRISLTWPNCDV